MTKISANLPDGISKINVDIYKNDSFVETIILDNSCNFFAMYADDGYSVVPENLIGYDAIINGTDISYIKKEISLIDLQNEINITHEEIDATQLGLAETFEYLLNTNEAITVCEQALAELYEMILGV